MADTKRLATRAVQIKNEGNALDMASAIRKAIVGSGITHKADVKRLMSEVGRHIRRQQNDEMRRPGRTR